MARLLGVGNGAGEGNRTPVVSLGSLRRLGFLRVFRWEAVESIGNRGGTGEQHRKVLPHYYRTQYGPQTVVEHRAALTKIAYEVQHGF